MHFDERRLPLIRLLLLRSRLDSFLLQSLHVSNWISACLSFLPLPILLEFYLLHASGTFFPLEIRGIYVFWTDLVVTVTVISSFGFVAGAGAFIFQGAVVDCAGAEYANHWMLICLDFLNLYGEWRGNCVKVRWSTVSMEV